MDQPLQEINQSQSIEAYLQPQQPAQDSSQILVIRHAESYYNYWKKQCCLNCAPFYPNNQKTRDPPLSAHGRQQAKGIDKKLRDLGIDPASIDAIFSSPLRRALQTTALGFPEVDSKKVIIEPLLRERVNTAGDLGSMRETLMEEFPAYELEESLPEYYWLSHCKKWKEGEWQGGAPYRIRIEQKSHAVERGRQFKQKLRELIRKKGWTRVALVTHSKLYGAMTGGKTIGNAEVVRWKKEDLVEQKVKRAAAS